MAVSASYCGTIVSAVFSARICAICLFECAAMQALRKIALRYPEAEEGIACKGTALECLTVKVRDKAFLFLGKSALRLKLGGSLPEAAKLAAKQPDHYRAGGGGWVKVVMGAGNSPPLDMLARWIDESYRLLASKQLVAKLEEGDPKAAKTAKPKAAKKKRKR